MRERGKNDSNYCYAKKNSTALAFPIFLYDVIWQNHIWQKTEGFYLLLRVIRIYIHEIHIYELYWN